MLHKNNIPQHSVHHDYDPAHQSGGSHLAYGGETTCALPGSPC